MLNDILNWRYATKKMDPSKVVSEDKVERILEAISLAPTSSGLQPFEVIVVKNPETRAKLRAAANDQAQLTDGSHLIVFAAWDKYTAERIDAVREQLETERGFKNEGLTAYYENLKANYLVQGAETNFQHAARQAYIAFGIGLTAAAEEKVDTTPMEGFDPDAFDKILGLRERGLRSVVIMPLGYRDASEDWLVNLKKVRRPRDEFVKLVA
ncbi:MAG TPA: NAD(P)H-dependent oxidoreductase [Albidovulum sp.]|uniref:NAD(P)H-dependent oxidoreductase n=1 Tax=Albidovulum sp. TaxID=1872424 RepID=UPI002CDE8EEC|nr:NAD(P)H-dependent oxidoreductase [Albidovulum sp.]